jgi:hypothetical protein
MTRKMFIEAFMKIQSEEFVPTTSNAIAYGIQRANFREAQLQKLIALASQDTEHVTVKETNARWKRSLERVRSHRERFERTIQTAQIKAVTAAPQRASQSA